LAAIDVAVTPKAVKPTEFERVIVGSTIQENSIANPMYSQLLEIARHKVVHAAEAVGIDLKQTCARESKELRRKPVGYVHAMKYHRLRNTVKHQRTNLGFLYREAQCEQFFYCASIS
jgi:IS5 family transposase